MIKNDHDDNENIPNYEKAAKYWASIPATIDGMLVGFGFISDVDTKGSNKFLKKLFQLPVPPGRMRALDCGAGIGRVTKHVLAKHFSVVDLVEQNENFLKVAKTFIGPTDVLGDVYNEGLQNFEPIVEYDVIWCQWVLGHLTDDDLIAFLKKCRNHLAPDGVIVVKENLTRESIEKDDQDSSITRPYSLMLKLFTNASLKCIIETKQKNFPKFLYRVDMFALRPDSITETNEIKEES